jgi:cell wall-associated NlpC family hydrolase
LVDIFAAVFRTKKYLLKNTAGLLALVLIATGCSTSKKTAADTRDTKPDRISVVKKPHTYNDDPAHAPSARKPTRKATPSLANERESAFGALQFKYAILLDVPVEEVNDEKLFSFIDSWYGTPYRYGGFSKDGVDCSAFTQAMMSNIYEVSVPRISAEQFNQSKRISRKELKEGDLVFFKTSGRTISHVGIYLRNNKFVHASTSAGVMISDLDEDYFSRRYAGSGRVR